MYTLNVISGNVTIESILNDAATDANDTGQNVGDVNDIIIYVDIATDGTVRSYTSIIGGAKTETTALDSTSEYTFDSGDVIVPFVYFLHAANVAEDTYVTYWKCDTTQ